MEEVKNDIKHGTQCDLMKKAIAVWQDYSDVKRQPYRAKAKACKAIYDQAFLTDSCFRAMDRDVAQMLTDQAIQQIALEPKSDKLPLCQRLRPPPNDPSRKHFLVAYNETILAIEKSVWENENAPGHADMAPMVKKLIDMADRDLKLGPYSVIYKSKLPRGTKDKRYYYSVRPFYWPLEDCPDDVKALVTKGKLFVDDSGFVHREGVRVDGSMIAGPNADYYDRTTAWNLVDNVTTLALAWHFTGDTKYSDYAAKLVNIYLLDPITSMYPSMDYSQDGDHMGLIDLKDFYYLTDAWTLLERSGSLSDAQVKDLQKWCAAMTTWAMKSEQGHFEAKSSNSHGVFVEESLLALALYAQEDDLVDVIRSRLHFRLSKPYPIGHFALDGSQPHESSKGAALHYITFALAGWIHAAQTNEAARKNSELPDSFESLLWVRHEGDENGEPVLAKAIRWLARWLPPKSSSYEVLTAPVKGMGIKFPFLQEEEFAFDRMLEIVQFGVGAYGARRVFGHKVTKNVQLALAYPKYGTKRASLSDYSSIDPYSGTKAWSAFGAFERNHAEVIAADLDPPIVVDNATAEADSSTVSSSLSSHHWIAVACTFGTVILGVGWFAYFLFKDTTSSSGGSSSRSRSSGSSLLASRSNDEL
jgi:Alginate lyase